MSIVMLKVRSLAPFFVFSGIALGIGCSSGGGQDDAAIAAAKNQATQEASDDGDWVATRFEYCELQLAQTGKCVITDTSLNTTFIVEDPTIKDLNPLDALQKVRDLVSNLRGAIAAMKQNICSVLGPFAGLDHPYFYYGAYGQGGAIAQAQGGLDVVWDMSNLQTAVFGYAGVGAASLVGVEGGAYAGYGFGNKNNVVDAWSGRFCSASISVGLPAKLLSAGATGFTSPDGTVYGGSVGVSVGFDFIPTPVDGSVFTSDWTEANTLTNALNSNRPWFIHSHIVSTGNDPSLPPEQRNKQYIQYDSSKDMALALLWNAPNTMGITAATQVLALAALKKTGLTVDQMCPNEAKAARDQNQSPLPQDIQTAANLCGKVPNPLNPNGSSSSSSSSSGGSSSSSGGPTMDGGANDGGLSPTDCNDKSDGWWCLAAPGWMAYCENHSIKSGCGCKACGAQGTQAPCTSDIYVCTSQ